MQYHLRQLGKAVRAVNPSLKVCNGTTCIYINDIIFTWNDDVFLASTEKDGAFLQSIISQSNFNCKIVIKQMNRISSIPHTRVNSTYRNAAQSQQSSLN